MTRIDQIIADALAGSPETHVAILAREVVRLREARAVIVPEPSMDDYETIPADSVLGKVMVAVDHRELSALREVRAAVLASIHGQQWQGGKFHLTRRLGDALDAPHVPPVLRANQGGAGHD